MEQGFLSAALSECSFEEVIQFASKNGFDCVEMSCWPISNASRRYAGVTHIDVDSLKEERKEYLSEYCKEAGVRISSLAYYPNIMDPDLEKRGFYIRHLKKLINVASDMDINMVSTFVGRVPDKTISENLLEFRQVWKPIIEYAEERKVKIAIENCPMYFTEDEWPGGKNLASTPPIWRELFSIMPSSYFGLNYDPSHFIWQKMDYIKPIYEFRDKIFHVHYKDIKLDDERLADVGTMAVPLKYMTPRIPGHGDIRWGDFISALMETGYHGPACIEIEDRSFEDSQEHVKEAILISKRYLSQYIGGWSA